MFTVPKNHFVMRSKNKHETNRFIVAEQQDLMSNEF